MTNILILFATVEIIATLLAACLFGCAYQDESNEYGVSLTT